MFKTVEKAILRMDREVQRKTGNSISGALKKSAQDAQDHGSSARFIILDLQWEAMEYISKWGVEHDNL